MKIKTLRRFLLIQYPTLSNGCNVSVQLTETFETLRISCLNKRNVNLIPIRGVKAALHPSTWCILVLHLGLNMVVWWRYVVLSMEESGNNYVINVCFTYNTYLLVTFWLLLHRKKTTLPPSCWPSSSSCWGKLSLCCWAFTWLNDCANDDEAEVTFVQTRKMQSLYYHITSLLKVYKLLLHFIHKESINWLKLKFMQPFSTYSLHMWNKYFSFAFKVGLLFGKTTFSEGS